MTANPESDRKRLLEILLQRSLQFGKFRLASGAESSYYVDVRKTSLDPEGAALIARLLVEGAGLLDPEGPDAVGGPTLGADPMVTAIGLEALRHGTTIDCFLVRKQSKVHGTGNRIEGNLEAGARALVVDDVLTKGGSLLGAIEAVEEAGAQVTAVGCVVDREAGGTERVARADRPVHALFRISELLEAAGHPTR